MEKVLAEGDNRGHLPGLLVRLVILVFVTLVVFVEIIVFVVVIRVIDGMFENVSARHFVT
jgi:hypothetical protein